MLLTQKISWNELQWDEKWSNFRVIALKAAHIDNSTLPEEQKERFLKGSNEVFVKRTNSNNASLSSMTATSAEMDGHYLIFETDEDYIEWIGHIQKISNVEKKAMEFRQNLKRKSSRNLNKDAIDKSIKKRSNKLRNIMIGVISMLVSFAGIGWYAYQQYLKAEEVRLCELEKLAIEELRMQNALRIESERKSEYLYEQVIALLNGLTANIDEDYKMYINTALIGMCCLNLLMLMFYIKSIGFLLVPIGLFLLILVLISTHFPQYSVILMFALFLIVICCIKRVVCCGRSENKANKKWKRGEQSGRLSSSN